MAHMKHFSDSDQVNETLKNRWFAERNRSLYCWKNIALVILTTAVILLIPLPFRSCRISDDAVSQYTGIPFSRERWVQYHWFTKYSKGTDEAAIDEVWSSITPAHGIVALDHAWAAEHRLPASMKLPSDHSKGVYIIDAYHQLHCLTIVRQTFSELASGRPLTVPLGHSTHCFDSIRQHIMCTASDTPLYTWGRNETGDGQLRRCRDWAALSQWAAENSACYRDSEKPIKLGEHFGHCHEGGDGLERAF